MYVVYTIFAYKLILCIFLYCTYRIYFTYLICNLYLSYTNIVLVPRFLSKGVLHHYKKIKKFFT